MEWICNSEMDQNGSELLITFICEVSKTDEGDLGVCMLKAVMTKMATSCSNTSRTGREGEHSRYKYLDRRIQPMSVVLTNTKFIVSWQMSIKPPQHVPKFKFKSQSQSRFTNHQSQSQSQTQTQLSRAIYS
ncbi:unnamed protein product [Ambrosiozyma monospora]|uniref:Unnamed protein product n=1 Tax=Ambrosiozyma monospora TaxID=43982 RepID=A0A9W6Z3J0_AMBMO|nr:unnamed protein product [Ambrosiozyma monospora]